MCAIGAYYGYQNKTVPDDAVIDGGRILEST